MTDQEITSTFNQMFKRDIQAKGLYELPKKTLVSQYSKSYRTSCQAWQEVEAAQDTELEWIYQELNTLNIETPISSKLASQARSMPSTPPTSPPLRVQKSTVRARKPANQTRKPSQLVSVVVNTRKKLPVVTSTRPSRNIFKQSPRSLVSAERTRTIGGEQVPIIRATDQDLVVKHPVTQAEAHSAVPELLFRFYDDDSQGVRTRDGEISGRHAYLPCGPPSPPSCGDDRMFAAVLCHLNTDESASELISTTSNLFFAMRLAAKSNANPRIYVIRGSAMPYQKVFHLWPYHLRFKAERLYYNGKYMNPSSHEYAVWATIPRTAIIYNFAFADLERHLVGNPYMASIFRVDDLRTGKSNPHIQDGFKKDKLEFSLAMVDGIARLMPTFGITVTSPAPVIARLLSEIIRGFVVDLPKTSPKQWDILGGAFAYALSSYAKQTHVTEANFVRAKEAFLSGARTGLGELNWHLNPQKQARMVKKGGLLGLGVGVEGVIDPARLEATRKIQKTIAAFAYKDCQAEHNDVTMDEDDTLIEDLMDDNNKDATIEVEGENTLVEDDEEAETDIEEHIGIKRSCFEGRRISHPREAARQSPKKANETFIIFDCSEDEDYVAGSDMEE